MTIHDPCKKGKCISYPVCLNKQIIICGILMDTILQYIKQQNVFTICDRKFQMTIDQARHIHNHITQIFPNLLNLPYAITPKSLLVNGHIDLEKMELVTVEKQGLAYRLVTYQYGESVEDVYGGTKKTSYHLKHSHKVQQYVYD